MSPETAATLKRYAELLDNAGHGQRDPIVRDGMAELGLSRPRFYAKLAEVRPSRKKLRTDAGDSALTRQEALAVSSYLMEGFSNLDKQGRAMNQTIGILRANGTIRAARVDEETGESIPLSVTAISRALRQYQLHPEQLNRPTPHANLKYRHPNHTHQVDSSVGTIYYLKDGGAVYLLDQSEHYKNKPWNLEAIQEWRVIRYTLVDMCTGLVRFRYFPKSENARHTVDFLAWCWSPKTNPHDPFHGVPVFLYCDGGIANSLVRRFCERLGVALVTHKPKNSRATGGVEGAHNYAVEIPFEHGLRDMRERLNGFDDINATAYRWQLWWNATKTHSRHKLDRHSAWQFIKPVELKTTCDHPTLLSLATERPKPCQVQGNLTALFKSRVWDVSHVPGVMVKGTVNLHWHPFIPDCAMAVVEGEDGKERHIQLEEVTGSVNPAAGEWGFLKSAAEFGEEFKSKPDTVIDTNRKALRLLASDSKTLEEDEKKRRAKGFSAHAGKVNPYLEAETAELPLYLKKRGTALELVPPQVDLKPLGHVQAAKILKARLAGLGIEWGIAHLDILKTRYPDGLPEAEIEAMAQEFAWPVNPPVKLTAVK